MLPFRVACAPHTDISLRPRYRESRMYWSCRRNHGPVSFRPYGARSSHWYIPQSASGPHVGGVCVVDDAVGECERTHARRLAGVGGDVGAGHRREIACPLRVGYRAESAVVVVDAAGALAVPR